MTGTASAAYWVDDPANCPQTDGVNYPGINCAPNYICGDISGTPQCYDTTIMSPASSATTNTQVTGILGGGYIIDCYVDADAGEPYCDNSGNFWCNRDTSCYDTQHRITTCTAGAFGTFTCGTCHSGYNDCDADGGICEIHDGDNSGNNTEYDGCYGFVGNRSCSGTWRDCDNDDTDNNQTTGQSGNGCEIPTNTDTDVTGYTTLVGKNTIWTLNTCNGITGQLNCSSNYYDCNVAGGTTEDFANGESGTGTNAGCDVFAINGNDSSTAFPGAANAVYNTSCNAVCKTTNISCDGAGGTDAPDDADGCETTKNSDPFYINGGNNVNYANSCNTSTCSSGYIDCDGAVNGSATGDGSSGADPDGCEVQVGTTSCTTSGGMPGIYDQPGTCTCTETSPADFWTGGRELDGIFNILAATYQTTNPLLWGRQLGTGELLKFGNLGSDDVFRVNNDGSIYINGNPLSGQSSSWKAPIEHPDQLVNGGSGGIRSGGKVFVSDETIVSVGSTITVDYNSGANSFVLTSADVPTAASCEFESNGTAGVTNISMANSIATAIIACASASDFATNTISDGAASVYIIHNDTATTGDGTITLSGAGLIKINMHDGTAYANLTESETHVVRSSDTTYIWDDDTNTWTASGGSSNTLWDNDNDTGIQTDEGSSDDDTIRFDLGGTSTIGDVLTINQSSGFTWNIGNNDLDFVLHGDNNNNLFLLDAGTDSVRIGGPVVYTPSVDQNVTAGGGITASQVYMKVQGSGGAVTVTATPNIADGIDGQILILQGVSDTNLVTLQDVGNLASSGLQLSGGINFTLGNGDVLNLIYDLGDDTWYELSRSDN